MTRPISRWTPSTLHTCLGLAQRFCCQYGLNADIIQFEQEEYRVRFVTWDGELAYSGRDRSLILQRFRPYA
jgi:hypothetical protein